MRNCKMNLYYSLYCSKNIGLDDCVESLLKVITSVKVLLKLNLSAGVAAPRFLFSTRITSFSQAPCGS